MYVCVLKCYVMEEKLEKLSIAELKIVIDESEKMRKPKLKQVAEKVLKNKIIELSK